MEQLTFLYRNSLIVKASNLNFFDLDFFSVQEFFDL